MLGYLPCYVARVTETNLGDNGREIKAESQDIPAAAGQIPPFLDGLVKLPAPLVGEEVLIIQSDAATINRWYTPIRSGFNKLTDDKDKIQLESANELELEGTEIKIGVDATEAAVLGNILVQWLTDLNEAIQAITVNGNLGAPTGIPINAGSFSTLTSQLVNILSTKIIVE